MAVDGKGRDEVLFGDLGYHVAKSEKRSLEVKFYASFHRIFILGRKNSSSRCPFAAAEDTRHMNNHMT